MLDADLPGVLAVQRLAYGDGYQESAAVLAAKLRLAPSGCWLAEDDAAVLGYVFAHPWEMTPPPLHTALADVPAAACALFVHDLAVAPAGRGSGVAARLFERVRARAVEAGFGRMSLVALADARGFWGRHGFVPTACGDQATPLPPGYGKGAQLMQLELDAGNSA